MNKKPCFCVSPLSLINVNYVCYLAFHHIRVLLHVCSSHCAPFVLCVCCVVYCETHQRRAKALTCFLRGVTNWMLFAVSGRIAWWTEELCHWTHPISSTRIASASSTNLAVVGATGIDSTASSKTRVSFSSQPRILPEHLVCMLVICVFNILQINRQWYMILCHHSYAFSAQRSYNSEYIRWLGYFRTNIC